MARSKTISASKITTNNTNNTKEEAANDNKSRSTKAAHLELVEPRNVCVLRQISGPGAERCPSTPSYEARSLRETWSERKLLPAQLLLTPGVANDCSDEQQYRRDFGPYAPVAKEIVTLAQATYGWSSEYDNTERYLAYCSRQYSVAADALIRVMEVLRFEYEVAERRDPTIAARYPSLAGFLGARAAVNERAAATRKARKKATEKK